MTFGKVMSVIGRVSMVVLTGLSAQFSKDWYIMKPAPVNPPMTTRIQKDFNNFPGLEIKLRPWMVEDSKNSTITFCILVNLFDN